MKRIDMVYNKLKELYLGMGMSAAEVAEALNLSRANVSSDLNKLCEEGKVNKSSGRPVLFTPKEEKQGTAIDRFAKDNQSLYSAVEQAKAAILYPPKGMHILILGETGAGKSMFSGLIHKYAVEIKKMEENSPFVTFNCADYANNPQLLISQIFGTKKGAYTGADSDKVGLIEKANGGILFLDEVHRLPPEGQEMFFTFMDKGTFRRLGETETERRASVLIVSATTENPGSSLLKTFTRRIPMIIHIPSLSERSLEERFHLISGFFREECFRLDKEIMVSVNSMRAFLSYNCPNNVGQLKTDIQLACAKAYADFVSHKKDDIIISSTELPPYIREGLYKETEHRQIWNKLIGINSRYCIFSKSEKQLIYEENKEEDSIYDMIDIRVHELRSRGIKNQEIEKEMEKDIEKYFNSYIHNVNRRIDVSNLQNLINEDVIKAVEEIVSFSEKRLKKVLSQSIYYGMAVHIQNSIERIKRNKKIVNPQLNKIRTEHAEEFKTALDCLKIIERILDITMPIDEAGFLTMFLLYDKNDNDIQSKYVKIIVIAHGMSTATSMADVANKLLGVKYAVGINAPLDEKPQQVLFKLKDYIKKSNFESDILFLVDMGSLTTFGEEIEKEFSVKTKTIPLMSTLHIIEAVRKAMMGYSLEEVYKETLSVNTLLQSDSIREKTEEENLKNLAIITVCTTGEGSALTMKHFIEENIKFDSDILEIIPLNLLGTENIISRVKAIEKEKNIIAIVSSFDIKVNIPQFGLGEVLNKSVLKEIQRLIDVEITYLKMGETLKNHLRNLDGKEVFKDIKKFISSVEEGMNIKVDRDVLIGVVLHMGSMIDRLKLGNAIIEFEGSKDFIKNNIDIFKCIRKNCDALSEKYNINILEDEICYIMSYFTSN